MKYLFILLFISTLSGQEKSCTLEISPLYENSFYLPGNDFYTQEQYFEYKDDPKIQMMDSVYVSVNNGREVLVTRKKSAAIKDLGYNKRHLVKIKLNNKIISSFYFSFKEYTKTKLRLYYNGYSVWQLH